MKISRRSAYALAAVAIGLMTLQPLVQAHASSRTSGGSTSGSPTTGLYQFWSKGDPVNSNASYLIVKGADVPSGSHGKLINYEQSFALNDKEAAVARSHGWLAHTCTGSEIHPGNIKSMTLLDGQIPAAVDWRSSSIAAETNSKPVVGTYLDTLRPYFNPSFYDGTPCNYTDTAWRNGSVDLVNEVRAKTGGRMIIANGAGMGTGRAYFKAQSVMDDFFARAHPEAVQIEHFGKSSKKSRDADFMRVLGSKGMIPFAKCDGTTSTCQSTFSAGISGWSGPGAYSTVMP